MGEVDWGWCGAGPGFAGWGRSAGMDWYVGINLLRVCAKSRLCREAATHRAAADGELGGGDGALVLGIYLEEHGQQVAVHLVRGSVRANTAFNCGRWGGLQTAAGVRPEERRGSAPCTIFQVVSSK